MAESIPEAIRELLLRVLYREFLLEPMLYRDAGLDDLPERLAALLGCARDEAVMVAVRHPTLGSLTIEQLASLLAIRDMDLVSRTAASVTSDLRPREVTYDQCIRLALCYGVLDKEGHAFSALRVAASKNDHYARHHYLYGIFLGLKGDRERALWELDMALRHEPYPEGLERIRAAWRLVNRIPATS